MTLRERALEFLERVKYSTPYGVARYRVSEEAYGSVVVTIHCDMPDNFKNATTTTVDSLHLSPYEGEQVWLHKLQRTLYNRACHEVDERLYVDGQLLHDPHKVTA